MKFINTFTSAAVLLTFSSVALASDAVLSMSATNAKSSGNELSLSSRSDRNSGSYTFDFIAGDSKAVVVQFDITINANAEAKLDLSSCHGGKILGSDHRVFCKQLDDNRVRVLVDSPSNSELPTSQLATVFLKGGNIAIDKDSVVVGDITATAVNVEVL